LLVKRLPRLRQAACSLLPYRYNRLLAARLRIFEEADDLARRVLQIVVHGDDPGAARLAQTGHDGVVLAEIARQVDDGKRHRAAAHEIAADGEAVVRAAVIDEDDLVPALDAEGGKRADQLGDRSWRRYRPE